MDNMDKYFLPSTSIDFIQTSPEKIIDNLYADLNEFKEVNLEKLDHLKELTQEQKNFLKSRLKDRNGKIKELEYENALLQLKLFERCHLFCNLETNHLDLAKKYNDAVGQINLISNEYNTLACNSKKQTERISELEEKVSQYENKQNDLQQTTDTDFTIITGFVQNEMPIDCPQTSSFIQSDDNFKSGYYTHNEYDTSGSYDSNIHQYNYSNKFELTDSNPSCLCKQKQGTRHKVNEKLQIKELVAPSGENQSVMSFLRSIKRKLTNCHGAKRNDKVGTHKRLGTSLKAFKFF